MLKNNMLSRVHFVWGQGVELGGMCESAFGELVVFLCR